MGMFKRHFAAFGIVIATILLSFLGCELFLRFFMPVASHDPVTWIPDGHIRGHLTPLQSYRTGPGYSPTQGSRIVSYRVTINHFGFRGPDWTPHAPKGTIRIAGFGGSSMFDYHDREEDTWIGRLASCLSKRMGKPTEILNLALPGYPTETSKFNYIVTGRYFHPNAILVYGTLNDVKALPLIDRNPEVVLFAGVAENESIFTSLARHSHVIQLIRKVYYARIARKLASKKSDESSFGNTNINDLPSSNAFGFFRRNFEDLVLLAQHDNVLPILMTEASLLQDSTINNMELMSNVPFNRTLLPASLLASIKTANSIIADVARVSGSLFVDGYKEVTPDLEHLEDLGHLAPRGQQQLSESTCESLARNPKFKALYE
jgi:hypothetical protein